MATNHTTNYNLNLWEPSDNFVREEFNENSTKLDAAIKAVDTKANTKADASALTAETNARTAAVNTLTQTLNQKTQIITGFYTGDGAESRTFYTGSTPKAVIVCTRQGYFQSSGGYYGGLAFPGHPAGNSNINYSVEIVTGGFVVNSKLDVYNQGSKANDKNMEYHYIAFV